MAALIPVSGIDSIVGERWDDERMEKEYEETKAGAMEKEQLDVLFERLKKAIVGLRNMNAIPEGLKWQDAIQLPFVAARIKEVKVAFATAKKHEEPRLVKIHSFWVYVSECVEKIQVAKTAFLSKQVEDEVGDYLNTLKDDHSTKNVIMSPRRKRSGPKRGEKRKAKGKQQAEDGDKQQAEDEDKQQAEDGGSDSEAVQQQPKRRGVIASPARKVASPARKVAVPAPVPVPAPAPARHDLLALASVYRAPVAEEEEAEEEEQEEEEADA